MILLERENKNYGVAFESTVPVKPVKISVLSFSTFASQLLLVFTEEPGHGLLKQKSW